MNNKFLQNLYEEELNSVKYDLNKDNLNELNYLHECSQSLEKTIASVKAVYAVRMYDILYNNYFKKIFDKYPKVNTIGWPQYENYYNDEDYETRVEKSPDEIKINGLSSSYDYRSIELLENHEEIANEVADMLYDIDDKNLLEALTPFYAEDEVYIVRQ